MKVQARPSLGKAGTYELTLDGTGKSIGPVQLPDASLVKLRAVARNDAHSGAIGAALPLDTVIALLEEGGVTVSGKVVDALRKVMDVDLDGDGNKDGLSTALSFTAVPAKLTK